MDNKMESRYVTLGQGVGSKALKPLIMRLLPLLDRAILWCFGWRCYRDLIPGRVVYRDPEIGENFWQLDKAIEICEKRIRRDYLR
jgi:hypothetical protein